MLTAMNAFLLRERDRPGDEDTLLLLFWRETIEP